MLLKFDAAGAQEALGDGPGEAGQRLVHQAAACAYVAPVSKLIRYAQSPCCPEFTAWKAAPIEKLLPGLTDVAVSSPMP